MGLTALDAGVMIAFLDRDDPFHLPATSALIDAVAEGPTLLPGIAYAESLVTVLRSDVETDWYRSMLERLRIAIGTCSPEVLARGAALRAGSLSDRRRRQWKLPDALIAAEAMEAGAETLVTTDAGWPSVEHLRVEVLRAFPALPSAQA